MLLKRKVCQVSCWIFFPLAEGTHTLKIKKKKLYSYPSHTNTCIFSCVCPKKLLTDSTWILPHTHLLQVKWPLCETAIMQIWSGLSLSPISWLSIVTDLLALNWIWRGKKPPLFWNVLGWGKSWVIIWFYH